MMILHLLPKHKQLIIILNLLFLLLFVPETYPRDHPGLPPKINGWARLPEIELYTPDNLYEYINGAAELYLSYDFKQLYVGEYFNADSASMVVDIYYHDSPLNAFGIYSQEKPLNGNFINIGAQAYWQELLLNFFVGEYYVKISGYDIVQNSEKIIKEFAKEIARKLGGVTGLPEMISCFPDSSKIKHSEKYVAKNYLGYSYFHSAFTAEYKHDTKRFSLFLITRKNREECRDMLIPYLKHTNSSIKNPEEGTYALLDPYYGHMALFWKSKYIGGVMDLGDNDLRLRFLQLLEEGVRSFQERCRQ
jgi:hypothetical protein